MKGNKGTPLISLSAIIFLTLFIFLAVRAGDNADQVNILITEVLSSNRSGVYDEDGSSPDFIELYNAGSGSISLLGWFLTDNSNIPMKWVIPAVTLQPGEYVYFFASGKDKQQADGVWHTNFGIAADGSEQILLTMPDGTLHRHVEPFVTLPNTSYGLSDDFQTFVYMPVLTPGAANSAPYFDELQSLSLWNETLVITEYMTRNDSYFPDENGLFHDWVEIYNPGTDAVELNGWYLSDNPDNPDKWRFPDDMVIGPQEYLALHCSGLDLPGHVTFRLSASDETLVLTNYNDMVIDSVGVTETPLYASYGRSLIEDGMWTEGYYSQPTPGASNAGIPVTTVSELSWNKPAVLIMEYMSNNNFYADEDGAFSDWVELYNYGSETVDLSDMYLSDMEGNFEKWNFWDGTTLEPGRRLLIWLSGKDKPGHATFSLGNNDDGLYLSDRFGRVIDSAGVIRLPLNVSIGRDEAEPDKWLFFPRPTPNAPNSTAGFAELAGLDASQLAYSAVPGSAAVERIETPGAWLELFADAEPQERQALRVFTDIDELVVPAGTLVSLMTDEPQGIIRYTVNGTVPGSSSREYSGPIEIRENTVLRARVYTDDKLPGAVMTRTYLIDNASSGHTLPVITLSTDPDGLFSQARGIFADGVDLSELVFPYQGANFWRDWEREAHFAFYEDGELRAEADAGIKVFGQYSRALPQKSISVFFKKAYGQPKLYYPLFPDNDRTEFDAVILRNSGQDLPHTKFKDAFIHNSVIDVTNVVAMGARPVAVYINGEYWGLYNLREKINEDYFEINEGIPDDGIDIIKANRNTLAGTREEYLEMVDTLREMNMNTDEAYAYVDANIDIDNWIDYWIAVTYFGNPDTGNIKCYKQQGEGNKWRWILFDQDHGATPSATNPFNNMLHPEGHGHDHLFSTVVPRALMNNDVIKERFIERYAELMQDILTPERLLGIIDDYAAEIDNEMPRHIARWHMPSSMQTWNSSVERMRSFARGRNDMMKRHLKSTFNLSDERMAELFDS